MTDDQISQLVQDCINGLEDPRKALHIIWKYENIHLNPEFIRTCLDKVEELIEPEQEVKVPHKSQWVRIGTGETERFGDRSGTEEIAYR